MGREIQYEQIAGFVRVEKKMEPTAGFEPATY
jgi:hypothetical protein